MKIHPTPFAAVLTAAAYAALWASPGLAAPAGPPPQKSPQAAQDARALVNLATYVRDNDYPSEALSRSEQGRVEFDLDVAPDGRVTRCDVTRSSGSEALDLKTCGIMVERARFAPARDARGDPVADRVSSSLTWSLR